MWANFSVKSKCLACTIQLCWVYIYLCPACMSLYGFIPFILSPTNFFLFIWFNLSWCYFLLSFLYYTNSIHGKPNTPVSWINNCIRCCVLWCWVVTRMWEQFSAEVSLTPSLCTDFHSMPASLCVCVLSQHHSQYLHYRAGLKATPINTSHSPAALSPALITQTIQAQCIVWLPQIGYSFLV